MIGFSKIPALNRTASTTHTVRAIHTADRFMWCQADDSQAGSRLCAGSCCELCERETVALPVAACARGLPTRLGLAPTLLR